MVIASEDSAVDVNGTFYGSPRFLEFNWREKGQNVESKQNSSHVEKTTNSSSMPQR